MKVLSLKLRDSDILVDQIRAIDNRRFLKGLRSPHRPPKGKAARTPGREFPVGLLRRFWSETRSEEGCVPIGVRARSSDAGAASAIKSPADPPMLCGGHNRPALRGSPSAAHFFVAPPRRTPGSTPSSSRLELASRLGFQTHWEFPAGCTTA